MTAPALPGAAPDPAPGRNDPARLPPEVERALMAFARTTTLTPESVETAAALRTAIRAALDKRGEVSPAAGASARALGGDGEPVAWGLTDGKGGGVLEPLFTNISAAEAAARRSGFLAVAPLYTRPAATGDTGEGAATLRRLLWRAVEILEDEGFKVFPDEVRATLAAMDAAKGGPDAR